jgi:hypothetical protein
LLNTVMNASQHSSSHTIDEALSPNSALASTMYLPIRTR